MTGTHAQASYSNFSFEARNVLRRALCAAAGQKASQVAVESVQRARTGLGITVTLSVAMGGDVLAAQGLVTKLVVYLTLHQILTHAQPVFCRYMSLPCKWVGCRPISHNMPSQWHGSSCRTLGNIPDGYWQHTAKDVS